MISELPFISALRPVTGAKAEDGGPEWGGCRWPWRRPWHVLQFTCSTPQQSKLASVREQAWEGSLRESIVSPKDLGIKNTENDK